MSWTEFSDAAGQNWQVNQGGLFSFCRAVEIAKLIRQNTNVLRDDVGMGMPQTRTVDVNWRAVNSAKEPAARRLYEMISTEVLRHPQNSQTNIMIILNTARNDIVWHRDQMRQVSEQNARNINRVAQNWQLAADSARFIRDAAVSTLVFLAAVQTGGATLAASGTAAAGTSGTAVAWGAGARMTALGLGSVGKGVATYQDTGRIESAVLAGTGTFTVGAMGLGPVAQGSGKIAMVTIQAAKTGTNQGLQSLVEGKSTEVAARQAVAAAGLQVLGGQIAAKFANSALPVQIAVNMGSDQVGSTIVSAFVSQGGTSVAVPPSDALMCLPIPSSSGRLTQGGLPANRAGDTQFVTNTIMRRRGV